MEGYVATEISPKYSNPEARATAAALPAAERQRLVDTMLVDYPLFKETVKALESFHRPVAGGTIGTGKICGILGESRAGKTSAIRYYAAKCGTIENETAIVPRIIYVDILEGWSSQDLAIALYDALDFRSIPRIKTQLLLKNVTDEIAVQGVELVVIDDAQYVLTSNYRKTVKDTFGFLVGLAERNVCNVVVSGTDAVRLAMSQNKPAWNRGSFPRRFIEPYSWLSSEQQKHFRFLLTAIDNRLPFAKPSCLGDPELAPHFYRVSDGLIGIVMNYVKLAAARAMNEGAECITRDHLEKIARENFMTPGDPYQPFRSQIDEEDPAGERRASERANAEAAHLNKKRPKAPNKIEEPVE